MALTDIQSREYKRAERLNILYSHEQNLTDSYAPMKKLVTAFKILFIGFKTAAQGKNEITTGVTKSKDGFKENVATKGALIANLTHAYALEIGDDELAAKTNYHHEKIYRLPEADILGFAQNLFDTIKPLLGTAGFDEYQITQAMLDELVNDAISFTNLIGVAQEADTHNTIDNAEINDYINKIRKNIQSTDLIITFFEKDNPKFVEAYHLNSAIDHTGVRHNGIEGMVKDKAAKPVSGAVIKLTNTIYSAKSDLLGAYRLAKVKSGDYTVEISAPGYVTSEKQSTLPKAKSQKWTFN